MKQMIDQECFTNTASAINGNKFRSLGRRVFGQQLYFILSANQFVHNYLYLVDAKVIICFERAMSFVQKEDVLIVLDETQLGFATFVLPKFHHFKFGPLLMLVIAFGSRCSNKITSNHLYIR